MEKKKPLSILRDYFGVRPEGSRALDPLTGQELGGLKDFAKEIQALSPDEKSELVNGAALQLGVEVDHG